MHQQLQPDLIVTSNSQLGSMPAKTFAILLIEDNPDDVRIIQEALRTSKRRSTLSVANDGIEAMNFLRKAGPFADAPRPDLIFLDLNLQRKEGREILAEIKGDASLKRIPVVVLTTSRPQSDIVSSYDLKANCYIAKPADRHQFVSVIHFAESYWLQTATRAMP